MPQLRHLSSPALRLQSFWFLGLQNPPRIYTIAPHKRSVILRSSDLKWVMWPAFLGLQLAESRLWNFLASIIVLVSSKGVHSYEAMSVCSPDVSYRAENRTNQWTTPTVTNQLDQEEQNAFPSLSWSPHLEIPRRQQEHLRSPACWRMTKTEGIRVWKSFVHPTLWTQCLIHLAFDFRHTLQHQTLFASL